MSLFDSGNETFKGAIHGGALVLNMEMAAYNWTVWLKRGTAWHLFSAVVYTAFTLLEGVQVARHTGAHGA